MKKQLNCRVDERIWNTIESAASAAKMSKQAVCEDAISYAFGSRDRLVLARRAKVMESLRSQQAEANPTIIPVRGESVVAKNAKKLAGRAPSRSTPK